MCHCLCLGRLLLSRCGNIVDIAYIHYIYMIDITIYIIYI